MSVRASVAVLPASPGVYRFRAGDGRALYIGRAVDLRRRVASYWGDLRDRPHLRRMVPRIDRIEAITCDSEHEAAWLERNLLQRSKPRWNRTAGGQEVPVHIRLDPRSGRLDVAHEHVAHQHVAHQHVAHSHEHDATGRLFGPYLGGGKVRLAVDGLHRVIPLAYTGDRLGGFDRDMARVRGVVATRESTVDEVVGVLERDPAAAARVRADLAARRDAAAAALAFELAARIQAELEALDWVLAEQKVTRADGGDAEVHGWSGGVLVSFEIRAGLMVSWRQQPCGEAEAEVRRTRTPAAWRPFADRGAALAAALLAHGA